MTRGCTSKHKRCSAPGICYGVLLRQHASKASSAYNGRFIACKVSSDRLNVVDQLGKSKWPRDRRLAMASKVEREDPADVC